MATHSSVLAWRIPPTEQPDGLQSTGSRRVGHYWATKHACTINWCCPVSFSPTMLPHQQVMLWSAQGIGGFQFIKLHWFIFSLFPILSHFSEHFLWELGPQQLPCPSDGQPPPQLVLQFHYAWVFYTLYCIIPDYLLLELKPKIKTSLPLLEDEPKLEMTISSVQFSSVAQSCLTLCDPMNRSTPGLPVHHQLPEFTETPVHRVRDAIQPSHPLSSPSPPAPDPSQN